MLRIYGIFSWPRNDIKEGGRLGNLPYCLFGVRNELALIPAIYHKFLVWEMDSNKTRNRIFQRTESFLDNFFPKSLVVYLKKGPQEEAKS